MRKYSRPIPAARALTRSNHLETLEAREVMSATATLNFGALQHEFLPGDLASDTTLSPSLSTVPANNATVSADGRYVVTINASPAEYLVLRLDRTTGHGDTVYLAPGGTAAPIRDVSISADGMTVAYIDASNQNIVVKSFENDRGLSTVPTVVPDPLPQGGTGGRLLAYTVALSPDGTQVAYYVDNNGGEGISFAQENVYDRTTGKLQQDVGYAAGSALNRPVSFLDDGSTLVEATPTYSYRSNMFQGDVALLKADGTTAAFAPGSYYNPTPIPGAQVGLTYPGIETPLVSGNGQVLAYTATGYEAITPQISPQFRTDAFISTGKGQIIPLTATLDSGANVEASVLGITDDGRYTLYTFNSEYYVYDLTEGKSISLGISAPADAKGTISSDGTTIVLTTADNFEGSDNIYVQTVELTASAVATPVSAITVVGANPSVHEFPADGTVVASITATLADGTPASLSLEKDGDGAFKLVGNTLVVADGSKIDYNQRAIYVRVLAQDGHGNYVEKEFAVAITPATGLILNGSTASAYAEPGTVVGQFGVTDGSSHHYTYYIHDTAYGRFALVGDTLVTASVYQLSHGPASVTVDVLAVDELGNGIEKTFTIDVTGTLALVQTQQFKPTVAVLTFNFAEGAQELLDEGRVMVRDANTDYFFQTSDIATRSGSSLILNLPYAGTFHVTIDIAGDGVYDQNYVF